MWLHLGPTPGKTLSGLLGTTCGPNSLRLFPHTCTTVVQLHAVFGGIVSLKPHLQDLDVEATSVILSGPVVLGDGLIQVSLLSL